MLSSASIRLIWSASLTSAVEPIDGFYIGYRTIGESGGGGGLSSIDNGPGGDGGHRGASASSSSSSSGSMPAYTFKTMYDLARLENNTTANSDPGRSSSSSSSSNMTTFCEVLSPVIIGNGETASSSSYGKARADYQQQGKMSFNLKSSSTATANSRRGEQIRCTYEFIVHGLSRKTRYG